MKRMAVGCALLMVVALASAQSSKKSTGSKTKPTTATATAAASRHHIDVSQFDSALIARLIFEKTNAERRKNGLTPFTWMEGLEVAATGHSEDMAEKNYFSHDGKGWFRKSHMTDRAQKAGVQANALAENIAMLPVFRTWRMDTRWDARGNQSQTVHTEGDSYEELTDAAVENWMNSPGHRKNILNPALTRLGVGVALGQQGNVPYVYLTQDFAGE